MRPPGRKIRSTPFYSPIIMTLTTGSMPDINSGVYDIGIEVQDMQGQEDLLVFKTRHQRKDGTTYPVEIHLQLMRNEFPPVFLAVIQDMEQRLKDEAVKICEEMGLTQASVESLIYRAKVSLRKSLFSYFENY